MLFKRRFFYLFGLITFHSFSIITNNLKAEKININKTADSTYVSGKKGIEISLNYPEYEKNFNNLLKNDFKQYQNPVLKFISSNAETINIKELEIISDTQYRQDNIFYAEGNVTLYLSNAELKGDKVSYDKKNNELVVEGNIFFEKGNQYFEASKIVYNLKQNKGYIENIYGVMDVVKFDEDVELSSIKDEKDKKIFDKNNIVRDLEYINDTTIGLENNFEEDKRFNITDAKFDVPSINKWRFRSDKIIIEKKGIFSKKIFFTNDPFNKPQLVIESNRFSGEIIKDKVKFIGRNNWVILENKVKFPVGRWTLFDRDPISKWNFGSDYGAKDGIYIARTFNDIKLFNNLKLDLTPYYLIQRSIKGSSNSFRQTNSSILSGTVKNDISSSDTFALDANFKGIIKGWNLKMNNSFNTLNASRLSESYRSKLTLRKSYNLSKVFENNDEFFEKKDTKLSFESFNNFDKTSTELNKNNNKKIISNFIDIQLYSVFREKVNKGYEGEEEIYFANGLSIAKKDSYDFNYVVKDSSWIYDLGEFKAKRKNSNEFNSLFRNVFAFSYDYKFPLWVKKYGEETINVNYKFTPQTLQPIIYWRSNLDAGLFLYSNDENQKAIALTTGPTFQFGNFKKYYLDFTKFSINFTAVRKSGESPFAFDDINDDTRLNINLEQQLFGPLVISYESFMPLDKTHKDYGKFIYPTYKLEYKRRAYGLSAYYKPRDEVFGLQFRINNFDYQGISPKF